MLAKALEWANRIVQVPLMLRAVGLHSGLVHHENNNNDNDDETPARFVLWIDDKTLIMFELGCCTSDFPPPSTNPTSETLKLCLLSPIPLPGIGSMDMSTTFPGRGKAAACLPMVPRKLPVDAMTRFDQRCVTLGHGYFLVTEESNLPDNDKGSRGHDFDGSRPPPGTHRLECSGFEPSESLDRGSPGRAMYDAIIREMLQTMLIQHTAAASVTEDGMSGVNASDGHLSPLLSSLCAAIKVLRPWYEFLWLVAKHTSTLPSASNEGVDPATTSSSSSSSSSSQPSSSPPSSSQPSSSSSSSSSHVLKVISVDYAGSAPPSLVCGLYTLDGYLVRVISVKIDQVKDEDNDDDEDGKNNEEAHLQTALLFCEITNGQLLGTMRTEQYRSCFVGSWSVSTDAQSPYYSSASHSYQIFVDSLAALTSTSSTSAAAVAGGSSTS